MVAVVRDDPEERMSVFRESLEKSVREMDALSREAVDRTDRLKVLLHDAQQWLEDLERLEKTEKARTSAPSDVGPASDPTPPSPRISKTSRESRPEPRTDIEKVLYLMEQGRTVSEIAQTLGRGEGEIELMLGLSRLSDGRSGSGR